LNTCVSHVFTAHVIIRATRRNSNLKFNLQQYETNSVSFKYTDSSCSQHFGHPKHRALRELQKRCHRVKYQETSDPHRANQSFCESLTKWMSLRSGLQECVHSSKLSVDKFWNTLYSETLKSLSGTMRVATRPAPFAATPYHSEPEPAQIWRCREMSLSKGLLCSAADGVLPGDGTSSGRCTLCTESILFVNYWKLGCWPLLLRTPYHAV